MISIKHLSKFLILLTILNPFCLRAQCTFTTNAPYVETFSAITANDQMPNCSWTVSSPGTTCFTYTVNNSFNRMGRNDTKFASFYYSPGGDNYFYTNGVYLNPGITYEAKVWYTTEINGYTNWTNLSILMGASQSSTSMSTVAAINGTVSSPIYTYLANTFTVATPGLYYFAVKATSSGSCCANYLSFDDFSITIPCLNLAPSSTVICSGQSATLTAQQANTFTWSNGANTSSIVVSPTVNTNYWVTGGNTLVPCQITQVTLIQVNPSPVVAINVPFNSFCAGTQVNLTAFGADTYSWSTNSVSSSIVVSPSVTTTYSVTGTYLNGCSANAATQLTVLPNPTITIAASSTMVCENDAVTFTASGAATYTWSAPDLTVVNPVLTVTQTAAGTTYAITGTGANGCVGLASISQNVSDCTGMTESDWLSNFKLYPNPVINELNVVSEKRINEIEVVTMSGIVQLSQFSNDFAVRLSLEELPPGLYLLKLSFDKKQVYTKFVKH